MTALNSFTPLEWLFRLLAWYSVDEKNKTRQPPTQPKLTLT
jgi:hypothetical protein